MVQTLPAEDFSRTYSPNVVQTFQQRIPGVTTNDVQGNEFTTDLRYRGFAASSVQGTPQGLAVYMQGIRVNEAFGDTVNFDLIPKVGLLVQISARPIATFGIKSQLTVSPKASLTRTPCM